MSKTLLLPDDRATFALGQWLGVRLEAGTVVLLTGDLGAGKTTLTKGLGQGLAIPDEIDSPTFTLINEYDRGRLPLYHVDLYRLEGAESDRLFLESYWEGIEYPPGIVAIEWAERLRYLPPEPLNIALSHHPAAGREVTLTPSNAAQTYLLEALTTDALLADEI
ncbi:tRNA (adenosine(37)-N6)-threonylcarbamoyltransferase complex ATPase subunit type 1 TsaE [Leptolyngbya iicbica LK]|uniref:tRNA threonylcarbamoyladenosine biosynthesis protein TsaE n=2 Tax=Cyanophyceae TaxID=3028117 RepID=A0A4Q7EB54_9CYAN|nr:tRNA (adenosine(37)-N6)-threonylcarbamoyltransferase complex ATPase subunit type 1 TsaE [Leptolyngbya sp. LK]RZM79871.1 tRNA (adenosine(37)-N6)-threonylcarbamoyltransferase complex ATPase subunit type 1 TsaE [Leptolyngbya sp. LK]